MGTELEPGIFYGIPEKDYFKIDALSNSFLCQFEKSPANALWYKEAPEIEQTSDYLLLGSVVHCLALEPHNFDNKYVIEPKVDKRTKEGKTAYAAFMDQLGHGLESVPAEMAAKAELIVLSMKAHPEFKKALQHEAMKPEVVVIWDNETGLRCKARVDLLIELGKDAFVLDLKTTSDIDKIHWKIQDYGYDRQQAMYTEGLLKNGFESVYFFFGFVSTQPVLNRYPCRFVKLCEERELQGANAHIERMERYKECLDNNEWNGVEIL